MLYVFTEIKKVKPNLEYVHAMFSSVCDDQVFIRFVMN